ncbi:MAG: HD domain-containing protein [Candidatus Micrarchaeota archaeon]
MSSLSKAIKLARKVHLDQFRRDGKTPYFIHPKRVAKLVKLMGGSEEQIILAYLHDVIENFNGDKNFLLSEIKTIFGEKISKLLLLLTREKNQSYGVYLRKIRRNKTVLLVKLCDMIDNLSDDPTEKQKIKYLSVFIELVE